MNKIHSAGLILFSFGITFSILSYFILENTPLTSAGIGSTIIGISLFITPTTSIPRRAVQTLMRGSVLGIERILEEFNIRNKAYYLRANDGKVYAYIPVSEPSQPPILKNSEMPNSITAEIEGVLYFVLLPPFSELIELVEAEEIETAVIEALVDVSELCEEVRTVDQGEQIILEINNPKSHITAGRFLQIFGSLPTTLAASIIARMTGAPVRVESEEENGSKRITRLRLNKN
jgi:hypothetical protein